MDAKSVIKAAKARGVPRKAPSLLNTPQQFNRAAAEFRALRQLAQSASTPAEFRRVQDKALSLARRVGGETAGHLERSVREFRLATKYTIEGDSAAAEQARSRGLGILAQAHQRFGD